MEGEAAEQLFLEHLSRANGLVENFCRRFTPLRRIKEDLTSESHLGLWDACTRYEPTTANTFWTFAYLRVRGSIVDYLRRERIFLRDRDLKAGKKSPALVTLQRDHDRGGYYAPGENFRLEDKNYFIEINRIETKMIIDSGTNGMSKDKKEVMKRYFCEGLNVPDIYMQYGTVKKYAWAAIREGVEGLKKENVMGRR